MSEILTEARRALWAAIRGWSELQDADGRSVFRVQFDWESENDMTAGETEPAISDFPAIEIVPASGVDGVAWRTNVGQEWPYSFQIRVWLDGWRLPPAEEMASKIGRAIYRSADPATPTVPYIKDAIGLFPRLTALAIRQVRIGEVPEDGDDDDRVRATLLTLQVSLPAQFNPFPT